MARGRNRNYLKHKGKVTEYLNSLPDCEIEALMEFRKEYRTFYRYFIADCIERGDELESPSAWKDKLEAALALRMRVTTLRKIERQALKKLERIIRNDERYAHLREYFE